MTDEEMLATAARFAANRHNHSVELCETLLVRLPQLNAEIARLQCAVSAPIPMLLWCPECGTRHIDVGEFATKVHHTHACQSCGLVWRPAIVATSGVQFLPGFRQVTP